MRNRAIEMLSEAYGLISYPSNSQTAQMLVRLAIDEVQELLDRLALYEASDYEPEQRLRVQIVDAREMTSARLSENQPTARALQWRRRAALTGNR